MKTLAALAAMTALVACTSDNDFTEPVSDVKTYQVNIHASFGGTTRANDPTPAPPLEWEGAGTTRAVTFDGTTSSSTFRDGERVYVYNATSGKVMLNADGTAAGCLTPTNISADGKSCDLTGTLTGSDIAATDQLLLMYNLNDVKAGNDNDKLRQYSNFNYNWQDGTATGVTDGATATMTGWSIDGGVLTTTGTAQFQNVQSMFRFSFKDNDTGDELSVKQVQITSQNDALVRYYYPMRDEASRYSKYGVGMYNDQALSGYIYMALCIDESASAADVLTFEVKDGGGNKYEGTKAAPAAGFRNGKYYYSSTPIALTLKERRTLPTITWTTPSTAPETIGEEMIEVEDNDADFTLSGTSEGVCFLLKRSGTVRLNGLTASYSGDMAEFISDNFDLTLDISGANTVACKNLVYSILACDNLKLQGYGTLTVTANDPTYCGIRGNVNYAPANSWQAETNANATTTELDVSEQLAATGYKVVRSARTDNADGTYTWTYTVYPATLDLATVAADVTIYDGMTLSGTIATGLKVSIADGATVTFSGLDMKAPNNTTSSPYTGIDCLGDATINLVGTNSVKVKNCVDAAIFVPAGSTLTIGGTGSLYAEGRSGAGIGGEDESDCGNIVINSGTITALGNGGAGIGSRSHKSCGDITINGGIVTATGGDNSAGIGSGGGYGDGSSCGNITINGGTVTATGGNDAAGIGSGDNGSFNSITIGSGITSVTATAGAWNGYGYGNSPKPIGYGNYDQSNPGTITISGDDLAGEKIKNGDVNDVDVFGENGSDIQVTISTQNYTNDTWTLTPMQYNDPNDD